MSKTHWLDAFPPDKKALDDKFDGKVLKLGNNSIDLHGLTIAQAKIALKSMISQCLFEQKASLTVIHGKGEKDSPMRKMVADFVSASPSVKVAKTPPERFGGSGVSILYFK